MSVRLQPARLLIAGPTAVGKSEVALELAARLGGEIISVDSMQVYRGLDIGTAKPDPASRARVPHHLVDVVDVTESFNAAWFVRLAQEAEREVRARGRVPIFCGGTGLYFQAFLEGLGSAPPSNARVREELGLIELELLQAELRERDPATFASIDRSNRRRVVRAVEVCRITGRPFSEQRAAHPARPDGGSDVGAPEAFICLDRPGAELRGRIDVRVEAMFARGLVEETRRLLALGLEQNITAMQAIGYRQVVEHLRGERSLEATLELVKIKTRQYAKRQRTWFRNQTRAIRIEMSSGTTAMMAADDIARGVFSNRDTA